MQDLNAAQLVSFGNWGLAALYFNVAARDEYIKQAHEAALDQVALAPTPLPPGIPTQDDILEDFRIFVLLDPRFENTVRKKRQYIDTKNHAPGGTYYKVATLFCIYLIRKQWNRIKI